MSPFTLVPATVQAISSTLMVMFPVRAARASESKGEGDSVSNAHSITSKASAQDKVNSKRKRVEDTAIELSSEEKDEVQKVLNQLLF